VGRCQSLARTAQPFTLDYSPNTPLVTRMELAAPLKRSFHSGRFGPLSPKIVDFKTRANATVSTELIYFEVTEVGFGVFSPLFSSSVSDVPRLIS